MTMQALLAILADGKFHSGQELGEVLGVSRSAIWKQIRRLENDGLEIFSVKGRGYRVPGGLDLLDQQTIFSSLAAEVQVKVPHLSLELSTASTNEQAIQACQQGNCHGHLYIAEQQTAGRGRRGRQWVSPFARNLYMSLVWRFEQGVAALEGLSLLVGLALVRAMENIGIQGVQVKWPNDLLYQGRKLAGILVEISGEASGQCQAVIGIGVNVEMPESLNEIIDQPWVDLQQITGQRVSRNVLLAAIVNELVIQLERFEREGFSARVAEWQTYHAHQAVEVSLLIGKQVVSGICQGVDSSGALLLDTENGREVFHGGEVSLRPRI